MRKVMCLLVFCLLTGAANMVEAASRKGLNVILLPHWSARSVENFLNVFKDSSGKCSKGSFSEIELGFLPYEFSPTTNYVNARSIINCFRSGGKRVYVNIFLSIHADGSAKNTEIGNNAVNFNSNFLRDYYNLISISVSPSLEDQGSDLDFSSWANIVVSKIDSDKIGRINLQRSPDPYVRNGNGVTISSNCFSGKCFGGTRKEFHGAINQSGDVYSNDGNFVYYPNQTSNGNVERGNSLLGLNPSPQYSLNDFVSRTNSSSNTVLLWRPAFNILRRYAQNGQVYFTKDGRDLSDAQTSINSTEQAVLRAFFGI
jgi:hypothetical protein